MAFVDDNPIRFKSGGYYQSFAAEYVMALALKTAAESVQDCLYYGHAGTDLENDHETKALLDAAFIAISKVLLRYFDPAEMGLFYEPTTAAPAQPEPETTTKTETPKPEAKRRTIGLPFTKRNQ